MKKKLHDLLFKLLAIAWVSSFSISAFAQKNQTEVPLSTAIKAITNTFNTKFLYEKSLIEGKTTSYNLKNLKGKQVEDVLKAILYNNDLVFLYIQDNYYTIVPKHRLNPDVKSTEQLPSNVAQPKNGATGDDGTTSNSLGKQQTFEVNGSITDEDGKPLEGATILVKGTKTYTLSDNAGNFTIRVPKNTPILMISHISMKFQEINVENKTYIKVSMERSTNEMKEVVVVAYGKQQKRDVVTAISTIQADEIMQENQVNIGNALQGKIAGAVVVSGKGIPGRDRPTILIRGINSKELPLIVVDGVPRYSDTPGSGVGLSLNGMTLDDINPDEVESISVLKDNAATALYGTRGAFGVIVVTTKRGKIGKPQFNLSTNYSMDEPANFPKLLDSYHYALTENEQAKNDGATTPKWTDAQLAIIRDHSDPWNYANTDLYSALVQRNPMQLSNSLSVRGGSEAVRYFINGSMASQKGLVDAYDYKRYSLQSNLDVKLNSDLQLALNFGFRNAKILSPSGGIDPFSQILLNSPIYPMYNKDGSLFSLNEGQNRLANTIPELSGYNLNRSSNVSAQANLEYSPKFAPGLTFRINSSVNFNAGDLKSIRRSYNAYVPDATQPTGYRKTSGRTDPTSNTVQVNEGSANYYSTDMGLEYTKTLGKHRIGLTALGTNYYTTSIQTQIQRYGLVGNFESINQASPLNQATSGSDSESGRVGGVGRLTYDYAGKYSLEYSMRADASDNFPKSHRWGYFSGGAIAWRLSEEKFIKDNLRFIQDLKIRASLGYTGVDNLEQFNYFYTYGIANTGTSAGNGYIIGGSYQPGIFLSTSSIPNPNVTWGKSLMRNLGVDFTLWKGLLSGTFDIWDKDVYDLPWERRIATPSTFGIDAPKVNYAKETYSGFETSLTNNLKFGNDMSLTSSFNFSYNYSRVIDRGEEANGTPFNSRREGYSVHAQAFYKALGIFQNQEEIDKYDVNQGTVPKPGDIKYADLNGDKKIDQNDMMMINNANLPPFSWGLNLTYRYKNLSLNAFIQGAGGNVVHFVPGQYTEYGYENAWRPGNEGAIYPRIANVTSNNASTKPNTLYMRDGDYARFKNLRLGYGVPAKYLKKTGLSSVTISVAVLNLMSISKIKDIDPEVADTNINNGSYYPIMRNYSLGINVGL